MKSTGIVRRIDELGRIVLPMELRNKLKIKEKDPMEIYVEGASIVLKKSEETCTFCGTTKNLITYKDKLICDKCVHSMLKISEEQNGKE